MPEKVKSEMPETINELIRGVSGALSTVNYNDSIVKSRALRLTEEVQKETGKTPSAEFMADLFYVLYLPKPLFVESDGDPKRGIYIDMIKAISASLPFSSLKRKTIANIDASKKAAVELARRVQEQANKKEHVGETEEEREAAKVISEVTSRENDFGDPKKNGSSEASNPEVKEAAKKIIDEMLSGQGSLKGLSRKKSTSGGGGEERPEEGETSVEARGGSSAEDQSGSDMPRGSGSGKGLHSETLGKYAENILKLAHSANAEKVMELLECLEDVVSGSEYGADFKLGRPKEYEYGRDLERIVPTELALPKTLFNAKFAEGSLLLYRRQTERKRESLYLLVDRSSSMAQSEDSFPDNDEKIVWAKAMALAIYLKSYHERRDFRMRFFDDDVHPRVDALKGLSREEHEELIEYVCRMDAYGTTKIRDAIAKACSCISSMDTTDTHTLIIITDGKDEEDRLHAQEIKGILESSGVRLITIMVKGQNSTLREVSSAYLEISEASGEEMLKVVDMLESHQ